MNCDTVTIFNRLRKMKVKVRGYRESRIVRTYDGIKKIKHHGLIPEKAYILGVLCGDAWMNYFERVYRVGLSAIDKDFVEEFRANIKVAYGIDCKIREYASKNKKWNLQYVLDLYSKLVCEDILSYGIFNTEQWRVPKQIMSSNDVRIIGNFLRGFYDSEGHVNSECYQLKATNTNELGIKDIMQLLSKLRIHYITTLKRHKNERYKTCIEIYITGSCSYKLFKKHIGFSIKRKQDRLLKLQNVRPQKRYTKKDFEKAMELNKGELSHYEISKKIGVIRSTVHKWFRNKEHYSKIFKMK